MTRIIAQERADGVEEGAFAVAAGTIEEEDGLFLKATGEAVANGGLQEVLQFGILVGDVGEEFVPNGRAGGGIVGDGREVSDEVVGVVGLKPVGAQINGAVEDIEQEGVGVESLRRGNEGGIVAGEIEQSLQV